MRQPRSIDDVAIEATWSDRRNRSLASEPAELATCLGPVPIEGAKETGATGAAADLGDRGTWRSSGLRPRGLAARWLAWRPEATRPEGGPAQGQRSAWTTKTRPGEDIPRRRPGLEPREELRVGLAWRQPGSASGPASACPGEGKRGWARPIGEGDGSAARSPSAGAGSAEGLSASFGVLAQRGSIFSWFGRELGLKRRSVPFGLETPRSSERGKPKEIALAWFGRRSFGAVKLGFTGKHRLSWLGSGTIIPLLFFLLHKTLCKQSVHK